jgi:hypothetical protein
MLSLPGVKDRAAGQQSDLTLYPQMSARFKMTEAIDYWLAEDPATGKS